MELNITSYAPFLIVTVSGMTLFNLFRLYRRFLDWEILSLMLACSGFTLLYSWIMLTNPPIEMSRDGLRIVLSAALSICLHVSYSYYKKSKLKRG